MRKVSSLGHDDLTISGILMKYLYQLEDECHYPWRAIDQDAVAHGEEMSIVIYSPGLSPCA